MPRMRTIEQAAQYIRDQDAESSLTKTAIRRLVTTGVIPSIRIGNKYLIDLDVLNCYLTAGVQKPAPTQGNIRRLEV